MNTFKEYMPAYFDSSITRHVYNFNTTEELLDIEFVKSFQRESFEHFAKSKNYIMAIYTKDGVSGGEWWVVGTVTKPEEVDLPEWISPRN